MLVAADNPGPVDRTTIELITLADGQRKTLISGGASPRYLATANGRGHLVYMNGATLFAVQFDLTTLSTTGTPVPVADDIAHDNLVGTGQFDVSQTGTFVHLRDVGGASTLMTLQWLDAAGKRDPTGAKPGMYRDVSVSPDGGKVALTVADSTGQDVWVYETRRDAMTRLTFGGVVYRYPQWSADGHHIVVSAAGKGTVQMRADGGSQPQALTVSKNLQYPSSVSPDGKWLAFEESSQIQVVPIETHGGGLEAGTPVPLLSNGRDSARAASFSPDGRWLAYESEQSGRSEVYVRMFPSPSPRAGGQWLVSNNGGFLPRWSRTGRDLLYQSGDQIMAVSYTLSGDVFLPEKPRVWIARLGGSGSLWDLAPDGKRVAVASRAGGAQAPKEEHAIVFVQNFFDELRRRVPLGR